MSGWTMLGIALAVAFAVLGPFVTIWSMNILFPQLAIPYDFWSWLAMVWLNGMVIGRSVVKRA